MSKRDPKMLLTDILVSIEKIKTYTVGHTFESFVEDSKTLDAVIRNFEIIGIGSVVLEIELYMTTWE